MGSADFPEDELLAEICLQALQAKGIKATPKFTASTTAQADQVVPPKPPRPR